MMLLAMALALADPIDALDAGVRPFYAEAEAAEATSPARAAGLYRLVLAAEPAFVPASLGLARCLLLTGDVQGAIEVYRGMPMEPDAVEGLARLVTSEEALGLYRTLQTLRLGDPTPFREEARLTGALAPFQTYTTLLEGGEPDGAVLLVVADANPAEAEALYRAYIAAFPAGAAAAEVALRLDRIDLERAAMAADLGEDEPLDRRQRETVERIATALTEDRVEEAEEAARILVAAAPRSSPAHGAYADVLVAQGRWTEAEREARVARRLLPDDPKARARLGWLLHTAYGGRFDREAAEELREAVRLRPSEPAVYARLARVEQALGNVEAAIAAWERSGDPDAAPALAALRRAPPSAEVQFVASSRLPEAAVPHAKLARELLRRGRTEEAATELDRALGFAPESTLLLNLRARLDADPRPRRERSLAIDPAQPDIWRLLGDDARDAVERRRAYAQAAAHGDVDAHYLLAEIAARAGDWNAVRSDLAAYERRASPYSYYREAAQALRSEADRRYWGVRFAAVAVLAVVTAIPLAIWVRRRTARTLRDLLDGAPGSWHEAARLLAGIRHEVLKHNTTVLPDVADALERGDAAPWAGVAARFPELLEKLDAYLAALESLGRRHGIRADLRHRDPVLGPAWRAMRRLARARTPPSPAELRRASEIINGACYDALGRLVREICVLPVDGTLLQSTWEAVSREPGFAGAPLPDFHAFAEEGLALRMFRNDLEDILANLLRNAIAAGARNLRVEGVEGEDPITGHGLIVIAVVDDAPGALTNAMIRSRFIGRGLGLAVDLVNRHGGSIRVEDRGEGEKAVVVEFMAVEAAPVEVEWTA